MHGETGYGLTQGEPYDTTQHPPELSQQALSQQQQGQQVLSQQSNSLSQAAEADKTGTAPDAMPPTYGQADHSMPAMHDESAAMDGDAQGMQDDPSAEHKCTGQPGCVHCMQAVDMVPDSDEEMPEANESLLSHPQEKPRSAVDPGGPQAQPGDSSAGVWRLVSMHAPNSNDASGQIASAHADASPQDEAAVQLSQHAGESAPAAGEEARVLAESAPHTEQTAAVQKGVGSGGQASAQHAHADRALQDRANGIAAEREETEAGSHEREATADRAQVCLGEGQGVCGSRTRAWGRSGGAAVHAILQRFLHDCC